MDRTNLTRRQFLRWGALAAGAGVLAACTPKATPTEPPEPTAVQQPTSVPPTAVPTAAPPETIELTFEIKGDQQGTTFYGIAIDSFNEQMQNGGQPWRVKAVLGPATDNDLHTKLTVEAAAGTLSDIVDINGAWMADFAAAGYMADLTPYVQQWEDWKHFYPVLVDGCTYDGKVRTMPAGTTFTFFYRKDVLAGAGIPVIQPNTWDDFYAVCDQVKTKTSARPCGLPGGTAWGSGTYSEGFRHVWMSFKGTIYDSADKKWVVKSPNLLKALQVYETLARNGWLTVDELMAQNPWEPIKYQEFPQGECTFVTGGDWQWDSDWGPQGAAPIEGLFDKVDRWLFPSEDGQPFAFVDASGLLCVSATCKHVDGAFEFLKCFNSPAVQCKLYPFLLNRPASRDDIAPACEYYRTALHGKMEQASGFFTSGRTLKAAPGSDKIQTGVAQATEDVMTLKKAPQQAMEEFAKSMTDALGADAVKEA